jgi:hypothetical protein
MNDVLEPSALVTLHGVPVDVDSVSVTRELSSTLPAQVTSASGITAATGSVEWSIGDDVETRSSHPWDGNDFPPKPADDVVVFMGYGDALARQMTGVVDGSSGSIADGAVSSELVDLIDKLNQPVTFPAHLAVFPPLTEGGAFLPVGNEPTFTTDRILRACGFNATPPAPSGCVLSVPLMGSAWAEVGQVTRSGQVAPNTSYTPSFNGSHWGIACSNIDADYTPGTSGASGRLDRTFQMTFKARYSASTGESRYRAYWGADFIQFSVTTGREIRAVGVKGGVSTVICSIPGTAGTGADVFTLTVNPSGAFTINANNGAQATGTWALPATMTGGDLTLLNIRIPTTSAPQLGGLLANFGAANPYTAKQTATLAPAAYGWSLPAIPRIDGRAALDVLKEQAEAECAAMWIDEQGVFRWVNRDALTGAAPVATLTALDDVVDIGWESNASGVRSKVVLSYRDASISRSNVSNQEAWRGSGSSMEAGQVNVEFAEAGADADWIGVDERMAMATTTTWWPDKFNQGHGSWYGGVEVNNTTERWAHLNNAGFGVVMEKVKGSTYKITTTAGTPAAGYNIELRTPDDPADTVVRKSKKGMNLPVLRAKAIVEWTDRTITAAKVGPPTAGALEHNVGPWVQDPAALSTLAEWLAVQVTEPRPVLRDLNVIPDFGRHLGDVVWVEDPENMRVRLKVLVTKISNSVADGSADQTIAGHILEVQSYGPTNAQLDTHAGSFTNAGFDTLWADATNAALDDDPLGRG